MKNNSSTKGSKSIAGKASGVEVKKDRRSNTGMLGSPKKGGHGGKFTWEGDGYSKAELRMAAGKGALDAKDPNFDEPETAAV